MPRDTAPAPHRLLARQLAQATGCDGCIDIAALAALVSQAYEDGDRDRRRTDRSIGLMVEELDDLNRGLEAQVAARTAELDTVRIVLEATLENVDQGIMMIDDRNRLQICNRRAVEILELPQALVARRPDFREVLAYQLSTGEFALSPNEVHDLVKAGGYLPHVPYYERRRPNGAMLEVRTAILPNGSVVRTINDITERQERLEAVQRAQGEYRSLFENAVVGIYRSSLDGKQLRANPALVRLNGYVTELDMLASVNDIAREWYVEPGRRDEFARLMLRDGRVTDFVSEIYTHGSRERIWVSETAWLVRGPDGEPAYFEGTVIDATDRKTSEARIAYMALHDTLTGLPNRASFRDTVRKAAGRILRDRQVAVHCLDLDRFKEVNDTLGHAAGDDLLRHTAKRISRCLREGDTVARLGGDEFAILQRGVIHPDDATRLAERLIRCIAEPFRLGRNQADVGASIGIVLSSDAHRGDADDLLKKADIALYRAKSAGRGTWRHFDPAMNDDVQRRRQLELDLRKALAANEFFLALQPILNLSTGRFAGFEALLRWNHPRDGLVMPDDFIGVAEETGLIDSIGAWALKTACLSVAGAVEPLTIAVNLSPAQFRGRSIVKAVRAALAASGLPPKRLILEITESVLLMDNEVTRSALAELSRMGVLLALDDFGTGHSTLQYLQRFHFDRIKIDRSFIRPSDNPVSAAIVRAVIGLGRDLGIAVVAEGVEHPEQLEVLAGLGCHFAQGYLLGRPLPADHWALLLARTAPAQRLSLTA